MTIYLAAYAAIFLLRDINKNAKKEAYAFVSLFVLKCSFSKKESIKKEAYAVVSLFVFSIRLY